MYLNKVDRALHDQIHSDMLEAQPAKIFKDRLSVLADFEKAHGAIHGHVLDIGAGDGFASIWVAKNRDVQEVVALEASEIAVQQLIPRNVEYHSALKVKPIYGDFQNIPYQQYFDFCISFGALHHAPSLKEAFQSVADSLKPQAYLICQEPMNSNFTSHEDFYNKYETIENRAGMKFKNGERFDRFFRQCEYLCAAIHAGLNLLCIEEWGEQPKQKGLSKVWMVFQKSSGAHLFHPW